MDEIRSALQPQEARLKNLSWPSVAIGLFLYGVVSLQSGASAEDVAPMTADGSAAQVASQTAIAVLNEIGTAAEIYVWPNRKLPFEVIGEPPEEFAAAVRTFNSDLEGRLTLEEYGDFPLVSFNFYRQYKDHIEAFAERTNLGAFYRDYLVTRDLTVDPCAFTVSTDRKTWAAQAAVFIDLERVSQKSLAECIAVAIDYVAGFPIPKDVSYQGVPPRKVRLPILSALLDCSISGDTNDPSPERSRDGFTALPSISCAIGHLRRQGQ